MDGRKDTLIDDPLERDLEALLAVDPSPGFVARIRARVESEPLSANRWTLRRLATSRVVLLIEAAAVVFMAVTLVWKTWRPVEQPTSAGPAPVREARVTPTAPALSVDLEPSRGPARPARVVVRRAIALELPEVILAENEARAYATLVAPGREAHLGASLPGVPNLNAPVEVDQMPKIAPVTLDPIDVKPIVQAALE